MSRPQSKATTTFRATAAASSPSKASVGIVVAGDVCVVRVLARQQVQSGWQGLGVCPCMSVGGSGAGCRGTWGGQAWVAGFRRVPMRECGGQQCRVQGHVRRSSLGGSGAKSSPGYMRRVTHNHVCDS